MLLNPILQFKKLFLSNSFTIFPEMRLALFLVYCYFKVLYSLLYLGIINQFANHWRNEE